MSTWEDQCGVCGSMRWWPSKIRDYKVCWWCSEGNALLALTILARRQGQAAVTRAQGWADAAEATCGLGFNVSSHKNAHSIEKVTEML
jgi:hypothetical protein